MALLPYLDLKDASPEVQKLLTGRPVVLNVQRMTANAQKIFVQRSRLSNALFTKTTIDPKLRELAILRTAKNCNATALIKPLAASGAIPQSSNTSIK